jgi:hypothetical protein
VRMVVVVVVVVVLYFLQKIHSFLGTASVRRCLFFTATSARLTRRLVFGLDICVQG